jgi:glycosyltransferase involved in cell wall biosynthesis
MSACIENDVTGIILKERSSEQMKDSIMALMNLDRVERRNRELYASERVFSQFSQQIQKQAWINFFSS